VAILLAEVIRERLATEVERLRPRAGDVAWVARDDVHLTLKFLGGVQAEHLEAVTAALAAAVAACPPFDLAVGGLGAFPSPLRPRVLWAGIGEGGEAAGHLAGRIDEALVPLGFSREQRPFSAHVTLGRVRIPRARRPLAEALAAGGPAGRQRVTHVSLMRSDLSSARARYTELAALPLGLAPPVE
jgi:2'-5' RNA ligase